MRIITALIKAMGAMHGRLEAWLHKRKYKAQVELLAVYLKSKNSQPITGRAGAYHYMLQGVHVVVTMLDNNVFYSVGIPTLYRRNNIPLLEFNESLADEKIEMDRKIIMGLLYQQSQTANTRQ